MARPMDLSVGALLPHLELASLRIILFRAFTFCLVLQMCVLYDNVLSRWTPRYTYVDVLSSLVPFQVTFSSHLASLFLRWKAHTWVLDGFARS